MPRPPRHFVPGYPVHLVHRGNNRQDIFRMERDYHVFRHFLGNAIGEFQVDVNAYVLMTNHIHLLLTPIDADGISRVMHSASRRYAGHFNAAYGRTGTLWEGRFHASLIPNDRYLLACHRYIDMNPVRAGIVQRPEGYRWSSHRHYAFGELDSLVREHRAIERLGNRPESRRAAYRSLFDDSTFEPDIANIRDAARSCRRVGGASVSPGRPRNKNCP
jgi:putative transposase